MSAEPCPCGCGCGLTLLLPWEIKDGLCWPCASGEHWPYEDPQADAPVREPAA